MSESFDIGPLFWVKDDIYQSLDSVLESVEAVNQHSQDTTALRFSQTYLYQVSGALDMVGLEGCKLFCNQLEKFAAKLEKKEVEVTPEAAALLINAIHALKAYIQDLLDGAADIPVRLYPVLEPLLLAMGETFDESELFFPDTSHYVPDEVISATLSEAELAEMLLKQRAIYQKSLLAWMQTKPESAVAAMHEALSQVAFAQNDKRIKTFWWVASAFIETLASPAVANNITAKKVCRKLDQALRQLVAGQSKPNNSLLRDMLYFIAFSDDAPEAVLKVRSAFSLDEVIGRSEVVGDGFVVLTEAELKLIRDLKPEFGSLHTIWEGVSNSIDLEKIDANADTAIVALDGALIAKFTDKLNANQETVAKLSQRAFVDLYEGLLKASIILRDDESKVTQGALIEVASALHLLDDALANYQQLDAEKIQRLVTETTVLLTIGTVYSQLKVKQAHDLDNDTIAAVIKDIQASLKVLEQSLDTFFRNPDDKAMLALTPKPLKQLTAIFDMLNLPTPMQMIKACNRFIQYFQDDSYDANQADFELLAESLSMIGLYTDEMPKVREVTATLLVEGVARLNNALSFVDMEFVDEPNNVEPLLERAVNDGERFSVVKAVETIDETVALIKIIDRAFDDELLDIYLTEAEGIIAQLAQELQSLRVNPTEVEPLADMRRNYHTLKGSGRTVGLIGQAEVAAGVENFLNRLLEQHSFLNTAQIAQLETITAAFADWTAELKANHAVSIAQAYWLNQVHVLHHLQEAESDDAVTMKPQESYVLISGKHKVSRQLYDIFLNESMHNIDIIEQDVNQLHEGEVEQPTRQAKHAVHTLASNALASGFKPMGELCRALENWLDVVHWSPEALTHYESATKTIAKMWQSISNQKMPRAARSLIKLLNESTEKASQSKSTTTKTVPSTVAEQPSGAPIKIVAAQADDARAEAFDTEEKSVDQDLLAMFVDEANMLLPEVGAVLRAWKSAPTDKQHAPVLQRLLHTLKGSARMAGQVNIGNVAHGLETLVLQNEEKVPAKSDFEAMFVALDSIVSFFDKPAVSEIDVKQSISVDHSESLPSQVTHFLRVREATLDRLINDAGEVSIIRSRIDREMIEFKEFSHDLTESTARLRSYLRELEIEAETQMQSRMNILQEANESFDPLEFDRFTRLQELTRMIAESVSDVDTIQSSLLGNLRQTEAALQQQTRMSRDLQQGLLGVRMLPFQQITERMQSVVRQTARELDKTVDLVIEGESTEIDRSVLEKVSAPLEHLLRNAVSHGIESKSDRAAAGKPAAGVIQLKIQTENDEIHITLSDDGAGVNIAKVKEQAIQNGLLANGATVTEDFLLSVIFEPGFSTASEVTQISGRGVGLDVVRNNISGLGGRVDMTSEAGQGARFNIYLPVTQSVAQVLMVRAGGTHYALPVALIEQAQKVKHLDLMTSYDAGKIEWGGDDYPIYHFAQLLGEQGEQIEEQAYASVLLLRSGLQTIALHVDEVIGNQEVVMKEIGSQLTRVPGVVGATVTGDGSIVIVMNPVLIAHRGELSLGGIIVKNIKPNKQKVIKKQRVLVVDDSLTMRKVLSRLLEREGYDVQVAKDGMDAMELLQASTPDIILTDIEMPRLDGFGLSRNIRDDARTANIPLIMISSRTADKHQNLAQEIGVDAFFGKPVQDDELIEKIKMLLKRD